MFDTVGAVKFVIVEAVVDAVVIAGLLQLLLYLESLATWERMIGGCAKTSKQILAYNLPPRSCLSGSAWLGDGRMPFKFWRNWQILR